MRLLTVWPPYPPIPASCCTNCPCCVRALCSRGRSATRRGSGPSWNAIAPRPQQPASKHLRSFAMPQLGERAVVLGASMGGLLAARVLADFYGTVTVVERDVLPEDPATRRGVPQGRHVHVLLARGAQILDELFPGILHELVADGAPVWDDGELSKLHLSFGGHERRRSGRTARHPGALAVYMPGGPFLECHVRRRLQAMSNVTILGAHDAVEVTTTPDRRRVTGVRVVDSDGAKRELTAEVVMDAMGRGAHTPALLERFGYGRPV